MEQFVHYIHRPCPGEANDTQTTYYPDDGVTGIKL